MRKWFGCALVIAIALGLTACGSSATGTSAVSSLESAVVLPGQEGQTVLAEALEFQNLLPKDRVTVSAIKHMETVLPDVIME